MSISCYAQNMARQLYLYIVTADGLVAGPSEEAHRHVWKWGHNQAVDLLCVTCEHCLTLLVLDPKKYVAYYFIYYIFILLVIVFYGIEI